jgi:hypothetical protein
MISQVLLTFSFNSQYIEVVWGSLCASYCTGAGELPLPKYGSDVKAKNTPHTQVGYEKVYYLHN